jgi:ATP adenylyltransferase
VARGGAPGGRAAFAPGTLLEALRARTAEALRCGALEPIPTRCEEVPDAGVSFLVRVVAGLARKARAAGPAAPPPANPFLPHDPDLFVAEVSETHLALLNKYNVVDHHLLLVTRRFEEQEAPLGLRDFEALLACMAEFDALGFYNSGPEAGASQRHRHLQLVPVPLGSGPARLPIDPLLAGGRLSAGPGRAPGLPFRHAAARADDLAALPAGAAAGLALERHRALLAAAGAGGPARPYNLLLTREWMLVVPRVRESFESVSVNALAFAGSFFVEDEERLAAVLRHGPMAFLRNTALPA